MLDLCNLFTNYHLWPSTLLILGFISSVRSSNSHPDLIVISTPLFQITPVLNTGLSLSEPLQLYPIPAIPCNTMQYHVIPCNTMQYHAIPCNTMQYHAIPCNTTQYNAMPCYAMQYQAIPCNTMQYNAIPCNTMQYHAIPCNTMEYLWAV